MKKRTREQIADLAKKNQKIIEKLQAENYELLKESYLLSDKKQQYREEMETFGRGKSKCQVLVGRVHWKQIFTDEDTGHKFAIDRSMIVKQNGEWVI